MNRRTLKSEKLMSSSPSRKSILIKGNLRKIKGNLRKARGNLREIKGNFWEQKESVAFDNQVSRLPSTPNPDLPFLGV